MVLMLALRFPAFKGIFLIEFPEVKYIIPSVWTFIISLNIYFFIYKYRFKQLIKNYITNMFLSPLDFFQNSFISYFLVYFPYIRPENLKYSSLSRLSDYFNWLATFFCSTPVFSSCVLVFCVVASFMYIYIFAIFCYRFSPIIYG